MNEVTRIADQLQRAFEGEAWHGPSLRELLADLPAAAAAARPLRGAHSIWEIVLHLTGWHDAVHRRLQGEPVKEPDTGDWPTPSVPSEEAWTSAVAALEHSHRELLEAVAALDESRLDEPVVPGFSSVYVTLHGVVQHDLYHAGQIALLKKAAKPAALHPGA